MAEINLTPDDWDLIREIHDSVERGDESAANRARSDLRGRLRVTGGPAQPDPRGPECGICAACGFSVALLAIVAFPVPVV